MERLTKWLIGSAALAMTLLPNVALAADPIRAQLDGRDMALTVAPIIENQRTLFPMRALLEALGASVNWDPATRTVISTLNATTIKAQIGNNEAQVNGKAVTLDVPPRIVEERTLVPLRFFVENFGMSVGWNGDTRTVLISTRPAQTAPPVSRDGTATSRTGTLAVSIARKYVGLPYAWGGTSPETGFDCSGFAWYVGTQVDTELPRTSQEMFDVGMKVTRDQLQAGDLVFFTTYAPGPSHVGIYDGNGSFVHAQSSETGVKVTALDNPWWAERYLGARRVFRDR
ncbi:MAG TPA: stalk domain-containing protein [Symbiobacteriaceae bacterium]|nr:stalk domain-containing protein [Symbiobacteriaceae bacterium]